MTGPSAGERLASDRQTHPATKQNSSRSHVGHKQTITQVSFGANQKLTSTRAMDSRLKQLIDNYLDSVRVAVALLEEAGIPRPASDRAWATNGISGTGALRGGATYRKHGYGCKVHLASGSVDFDFGRAGQINGFDMWRLADFAGDRLAAFGFNSQDELEHVFKAEVESGEISKSDYILHYTAEASEAGR